MSELMEPVQIGWVESEQMALVLARPALWAELRLYRSDYWVAMAKADFD